MKHRDKIVTGLLALTAITVVLSAPAATTDTPAPFELAETGCSMAHCDVRMSDNVGMPAPVADDLQVLWHRNDLPGEIAGSGGGIGCAGNGNIAACSYRGERDNVVAYDWDGNRLWTSGDLLNFTARTSVPLVATDGGVIAADENRLIRFDAGGKLLWGTPTPGGTPISPVMTASGAVLLATNGGPLSAYDNQTGEMLGQLTVKLDDDDEGSFETINTPSVQGNRIYVTMRHQVDDEVDEDNLHQLVAVDVDTGNPDPEKRLEVAWTYKFNGPSGASPLLIEDTLYFDAEMDISGDREPESPHLFAVRDLGDGPQEVWRTEFEKPLVVSATQDPRGGLWVFPTGKRIAPLGEGDILRRLNPEPEKTGNMIRVDQDSGEIIETFRIDELLGITDPETHFVASSAMTIAERSDTGDPVMILNVTSFPLGALILIPEETHIIAVDLETLTLLWDVELPAPEGATFGAQFPVLDNNGDLRLVFSSEFGGVRAIGSPVPLPSSVLLIGSAVLCARLVRRRRRAPASA